MKVKTILQILIAVISAVIPFLAKDTEDGTAKN